MKGFYFLVLSEMIFFFFFFRTLCNEPYFLFFYLIFYFLALFCCQGSPNAPCAIKHINNNCIPFSQVSSSLLLLCVMSHGYVILGHC